MKMQNSASPKTQQGVATLLLVTLIALGLAAATASMFKSASGSQKMLRAEHTVTQAEMSAWTGVELLSQAVAKLPSDAELTAGEVQFSGAQPGLSARYVEQRDGLFVFDVVGSSAGARSVVRAAFRPPSASEGGSGGDVQLPRGTTLHGDTTLRGSIQYTGSTPNNLYVLDGDLTLQGSVSGLEQVCATGNIDIGSAIHVDEVCANGNVVFKGAATVNKVTAIGSVTLQGGAATAIGDIHSNGDVTLSGGSATAGAVLASGNVAVTGGSARATTVRTAGDINWTSSATGAKLEANGTVNYRPSGTTVATDISSIGNVTVTSARNVRTKGATTLVGYYGQGLTGRLDGQGLLGGASWGSGGGAVVNSGTVGSVVLPKPTSVRVTVSPGYTVSVDLIVVPAVPVFKQTRVTVDAYALQAQANLAFLGVDGNGNPRVRIANVNGVDAGDYFIANNQGVSENYLCKNVSGTNCVAPLIKVCHGQSNSNRCFSYSNGRWSIDGRTMLPWVLWFEGNLNVGNGTWVNTFLATGDITTSGSLKIYSPNYPNSAFSCRGQAHSNPSLQAWSTNGLAASAYATQLCAGATPELRAAAIGNIALLAGGLRNGSFVGGNIDLGSSNEIYGAILAGQYINTGGSTTIAGSMYAAGQGGSTARTTNSQGGSTTIHSGGGSPAYNPGTSPCMSNCEQPTSTTSNVVWAAPV